MKLRTAAAITAAALTLFTAEMALAQTLSTDRQVLAPGTWRARTGQAAVLSAEVRMTDGSPLQVWADSQEGSTAAPHQLTITDSTTDIDDFRTPGIYIGRWDLASGVPADAKAGVLWVTSAPTQLGPAKYANRPQQALIEAGWSKVWTRARRGTWSAWAEHDLSAQGLTADQVAAAIAAQEGQQSSDVLDAILGLLLRRTGDSESFTFSGYVGRATDAAENFGSRLDADDDLVLRIDVQLLNEISGAVLATYDPILVVRATISALSDAGSTELLNTDAKRISYPLLVSGVPPASGQELRIGRNGTGLLIGFGVAESVAYRVTASGLDETVDAEGVQSALQSLPDGSVDGHALRDVPVSYGATLPAVASSQPGTLFVQETAAGSGNLRWLRPAAAVPTPNRNRVQVVAQAADQAYRGWEDDPYDPSKTPDNYQQLLGGLERIPIGSTTTAVYSVYLRESLLSGLGIDTAQDNGVKVQIGLFGEMRPFKRFSENDLRLGPTTEITARGVTYLQFRTDPIANAPQFAVGTTYSLLFWQTSNNSAVNFKPATSRAPAAWEPPVPAPVLIATGTLPTVTGRRVGDQALLRGGTTGSRTWTLYVLAPDEDGDPGAWVRPS